MDRALRILTEAIHVLCNWDWHFSFFTVYVSGLHPLVVFVDTLGACFSIPYSRTATHWYCFLSYTHGINTWFVQIKVRAQFAAGLHDAASDTTEAHHR